MGEVDIFLFMLAGSVLQSVSSQLVLNLPLATSWSLNGTLVKARIRTFKCPKCPI
jgi:hypothetical protein